MSVPREHHSLRRHETVRYSLPRRLRHRLNLGSGKLGNRWVCFKVTKRVYLAELRCLCRSGRPQRHQGSQGRGAPQVERGHRPGGCQVKIEAALREKFQVSLITFDDTRRFGVLLRSLAPHATHRAVQSEECPLFVLECGTGINKVTPNVQIHEFCPLLSQLIHNRQNTQYCTVASVGGSLCKGKIRKL